jgi:hypothetical protein
LETLKGVWDNRVLFNDYIVRKGLMCSEIIDMHLCCSLASGFGIMHNNLDEKSHPDIKKTLLYLNNDFKFDDDYDYFSSKREDESESEAEVVDDPVSPFSGFSPAMENQSQNDRSRNKSRNKKIDNDQLTRRCFTAKKFYKKKATFNFPRYTVKACIIAKEEKKFSKI